MFFQGNVAASLRHAEVFTVAFRFACRLFLDGELNGGITRIEERRLWRSSGCAGSTIDNGTVGNQTIAYQHSLAGVERRQSPKDSSADN